MWCGGGEGCKNGPWAIFNNFWIKLYGHISVLVSVRASNLSFYPVLFRKKMKSGQFLRFLRLAGIVCILLLLDSRTALGTSLKIIAIDHAIRWIPLVSEKQLVDPITQLSWKITEWEELTELSRVCRVCRVPVDRKE